MPPKKSKQRGFIGIQRQNMPAVAVAPSAKVSVPAKPVEPASKTKLEIPMAASSLEVSTPMVLRSVTQPNPSTSEFCGYEAELEGNHIVECKGLVRAVSALAVCNGCRAALTVTESLSTRRGLVSRMSLCCSNPECSREALITDPYSKECTDLDTRSVQGMRAIGRGRAGLETFCGMMELLPPVSASNYLVHNSKIATASVEAASENMRAASVHLHHLFSVAPSEILDVAVTCDGTWSKRGFTATYGVVVVISWLTGQVLDYEVLSKRCKVCSLKKQKVSSEEFVEWFEQHKPHCQLNHLGSSPVMEPEGAMRIWNRSEQKLHLRYTSMISDGDCKTHTQLNDLQPYGPDAKVVKHECVSHVEKRMATRLRNLKKTKVFGADGKQLRWGGAGRLTNAFIDQLAQYYGNAIRSHTNDLEATPSMTSVPKVPIVGADTIRPLLGVSLMTFLHHTTPPSYRLMLLIMSNLSLSASLTRSSSRYASSVRPKTRTRASIALSGIEPQRQNLFPWIPWRLVGQAAIIFNSGRQAITSVMTRLNLQPGPLCNAYLAGQDHIRAQRSEAKATKETKRQRQ